NKFRMTAQGWMTVGMGLKRVRHDDKACYHGRMTVVYLALGSNVGDSAANIAEAIKLLGNSIESIKQAPLYASKAAGYTDQPDFVNTAVSGETSLNPEQLLSFVKDIEQQIGLINRFRWGPREIDIDIIFYGDT